ncbi:MAG: hypothetical protein M1821_000351 [Bathelium mastoideum]|nr:MAG: hypothetical protein M1821_000351 [Bathelium mastoideum]KAI9686159.1 MAG: hypothetical protein M1822_003814 [Bathelium mastoideum]
MTTAKPIEGVIAVNKPPALSSAGVLRKLQEHFNPSKLFAPLIAAENSQRAAGSIQQRKKRSRRTRKPPEVKLGHGGTLDPLATGVLAVGIGSGTKSLSRFLACTKGYECVVLFGAATDTYDRLGKVVKRAPYDHLSKQKVQEALTKFKGKLMQKPPIFSALRINGKKMYEYAREGKELPIEIQERPVEVIDMEMIEWMDGGTHGHELPKTEAEQEEKVVADKLLNLGEGTRPWSDGKSEDNGESLNASSKRPRSKSAEDEFMKDVPQKRVRSSTDSPTMSGALPPDENPPSEDVKELGVGKEEPKGQDENFRSEKNEEPLSPGPPAVKLRMTVTSGFYVRSFCHDLGAAVGSLGLMSELVRTRQGVFELGKNVLEYDVFEKGEEAWVPKVENSLEAWSTELSPITEVAGEEQGGARRRNSSSELEDHS